MEPSTSLLHPLWAFGLPIAASIPLGWSMARSLDPPADRAGKGLDALPMFLCRLMGRREPARMGWKQYCRRPPGLQRRAVRHHLRAALHPAASAAQPRRQGVARGLGLQGHRGRRPPRRRHRRDLQHRLLVRDQHEPPALLGRAAPVVLQPVGLHRLDDVRDPGGRPLRHARGAPRAARRRAPGRLLPRPDARPGLTSSCPWPWSSPSC